MVILDLLSNPASDDVMGSGLHADDAPDTRDGSGSPPRLRCPMGADPDRMVDILNSDAAIRTRGY